MKEGKITSRELEELDKRVVNFERQVKSFNRELQSTEKRKDKLLLKLKKLNSAAVQSLPDTVGHLLEKYTIEMKEEQNLIDQSKELEKSLEPLNKYFEAIDKKYKTGSTTITDQQLDTFDSKVVQYKKLFTQREQNIMKHLKLLTKKNKIIDTVDNLLKQLPVTR